MDLKMYQFDGGVQTWICATNATEAINIFKSVYGSNVWSETYDCYGEHAVRELLPDHPFTYYHDGINPEKDTIQNLISKYCTKPDIFATSDF